MNLKIVKLVFFLLCIYTFAINALDFSDLEPVLYHNCSRSRNSCADIDRNFSLRNCECDRSCNQYDDCCIDARGRQPQLLSRRTVRFSCMSYGLGSDIGVYVIDTCARNFAGSADLQEKCSNQTDISDPVMAAPVTDTSTWRTYRNRYCALCNNVDLSNIIAWTIRMTCDTRNVNQSFIWENVRYIPESNSWGIYIGQNLKLCDLHFHKPADLTRIRPCRSQLISGCPTDWHRLTVKTLCESYTAVMYTMNGFSYKNPHCAICNGIQLREIYCESYVFSRKKPVSIAEYFDFNTNSGDVVGMSPCRSDQIYDPYFKKCRNKACAINC